MDLTDFCPFKSPSEAPGSLFSPSLHVSGASRHPPLPLPWQPPPQHPPWTRLPKISPQSKRQRGLGWPQHCSEELVFSPRERG